MVRATFRIRSCARAKRPILRTAISSVRLPAGAGKRPAEALEIARREAELRHDVSTRDALAFALNTNGRSAEARSVMKEVLAVGTRDPEILRHAAQIGVNPR